MKHWQKQEAKLQEAAGLAFFRKLVWLPFRPVSFLKPFCTLDGWRSFPVQWATTTSIRTLAHIFTNPTPKKQPSIQIGMQLWLPQEKTPQKAGRGCLLLCNTTRTFHVKLSPRNPKRQFLLACVPLCTRRREGEGPEITTQSNGAFSTTECKQQWLTILWLVITPLPCPTPLHVFPPPKKNCILWAARWRGARLDQWIDPI